MTEWARRASPELNQMYTNTGLALPPYGNTGGIGYVHGSIPYSTMGSTYSAYSTPYLTGQNPASNMMYLPSSPVPLGYQMQPSRSSQLASQSRGMSHGRYYSNTVPSSRHVSHVGRYPLAHDLTLVDTEDQESTNRDSQRSEPVTPPLEGYPDVHDFDRLMNHYVANLSPKKQDKALIHAKRAANIKAVLIDKKTTSVESAQFRFWVKKMFTLQPNDQQTPAIQKKICHDNKPVAIREKLFKILTKAHKQCQHGGRDKTSAQVRKVYSWVPKELISRFVKICPTCRVRRGTNRGSPAGSDRSPDPYMDGVSPETNSPDQSRRTSMATTHMSNVHSPLQMSNFSSAFQQQNRWMTPLEASDKLEDRMTGLDVSTASLNAMQTENSFPEQAQHLMKTHRTVSQSNYSSMNSHQAMDLSGPSFDHMDNQQLSYHPGDMRYSYKSNHYKA